MLLLLYFVQSCGRIPPREAVRGAAVDEKSESEVLRCKVVMVAWCAMNLQRPGVFLSPKKGEPRWDIRKDVFWYKFFGWHKDTQEPSFLGVLGFFNVWLSHCKPRKPSLLLIAASPWWLQVLKQRSLLNSAVQTFVSDPPFVAHLTDLRPQLLPSGSLGGDWLQRRGVFFRLFVGKLEQLDSLFCQLWQWLLGSENIQNSVQAFFRWRDRTGDKPNL